MENSLPKKVLVLGARGFLGEHIVQELAASDYDVVAAVRPGSSRDYSSPRVTLVEGDLLEPSFVRGALEGVDAVVFAAGRTWQPGLDVAEYHRQNVEITRRFFEALGHRPQVRVVFTSSLATVSGSRTPRVFAEDSGRREVCEGWLSPYARAKILCERLALGAAEAGNRVVVLNPGQLLGPGVRSGSNLASAFVLLWPCQRKAPFYVRGGVTVSDVRDVAWAHVSALVHGRSGQRYILGGHCIDRAEFYAQAARLTGLRPPGGLPVWVVYLVMALADGFAFLSGGLFRSPVHRTFARGEGLYYYGDSQKAVRELAYRITPIQETIYDTLRYYHGRGLLPPEMDFVEDVGVEDAPAFVLLRQLAGKSAFSRFLLARIGRVYEMCRSNHQLRAALTRLLDASQVERGTKPFPLKRDRHAEERKLLNQYFEYLYFASDEFLRRVR
ncbi:MAG TPA: NAD-dependent epimerase/dehydratase family protein [Candidatus Methylomirabilis sp.]|nr:NAD-dependent epimerase/dehydratase family protein [Candidatus Methylomirabilis sp.]